MFYKRDIFFKLENELETKEAVVITGMRQVGKTTTLNHLFGLIKSGNKVLLDLENPLHRKVFEEENFDVVWHNLMQFNIKNTEKAYIFLDEIQNLPKVSSVVKYLYDHWKVKFFLTGSSSYYLKNLFPESLAGRKIVFEMFPLTFSEFLRFKGKKKETYPSFSKKAQMKNRISYEQNIPYYREYIEFGGFPAVVLEQSQERKRMLLQEIFTSYFEKDAKNLADFREMSKLRDLILILVPRIGQRLEIGKVAGELSISRETVYSYLTFLEKTYFISLLPKFSKSIDRQAAGSKKLYFCDGGIASALGRLSNGQLFEQSVFQNLKQDHILNFYSKEGKNEIDFIVDKKTAIEVKQSASLRDIDYLQRRSNSLGLEEFYTVSFSYSSDPRVVLAIDL